MRYYAQALYSGCSKIETHHTNSTLELNMKECYFE